MISKGIVGTDSIQWQKIEERLREAESALPARKKEDFESTVRLARLYPFRSSNNGSAVCKQRRPVHV